MIYEFKYANEITFVRRASFTHLMLEKFPDRKGLSVPHKLSHMEWTAHSTSISHCSTDVPSPYIREKYS